MILPQFFVITIGYGGFIQEVLSVCMGILLYITNDSAYTVSERADGYIYGKQFWSKVIRQRENSSL